MILASLLCAAALLTQAPAADSLHSDWSAGRRAGKAWADSVRRAGVVAFSRDGPRAAIAIWRRALARASAIRDTAGMAAVLGNIGAGYLEELRLDSAESYLERSRSLAAAIRETRIEANAVGSLGGVSEERGDFAAARERYGRALALRAGIGDTRGVAAHHNNLGLLAQSLGDLDAARREYDAALAINRRDGRDEVAATNLVNLAGLASLGGDFTRAETLYRDALAVWRGREQWVDAAVALHGLGQLEMRRGDYPAARAALREAAGIYGRTGPLPDELLVRRDLAATLAAQGELQAAIDELRAIQRVADSERVAPGVRAGIMLARADLAMQLNAWEDAETWYGAAEVLYRRAGDGEGEAEAQEGRGLVLLDRDDPARAHALFATALRTQLGRGNQRAAALVRLSLGLAALARGDTAAGRVQLARSAEDLGRLGDPVGTAAALGERAALEASAGFPAVADSLYRAALARLEGRVVPDVAWRLHAGLGAVLRARSAPDLAARELRLALAEIELPSRSLALAERRSGFRHDKWDVYAELALLERSRGRTGAAFEASERLRAREMLELLARGRVGAPVNVPADLVAREQDLRRHIAELTTGLGGSSGGVDALRGPDVSTASGIAREALMHSQRAYAELILEIGERAPRHAALLSSGPVTWRDVARRLAPTEAFIEYLVSDSASLAFVIRRDSVSVLDLGVGRRALAQLVAFTRGTMEPPSAGRPDSLWRAALGRLHQYLVAPLETAGLLSGATQLVVVPHAELHYLPFAALRGVDGFLVERYAVVVAPSAATWLALGDRPARASAGVLALAPNPALLVASGEEVNMIARLGGPDVRVLRGSEATEAAFRRDAPTRRLLHLATYGILNKQNPLFSFVELAADSTHDGRLETHEVFGLSLAADLVVLSACQTALGSGSLADVPPGDDWISLARAFLHAGASRVMASLWPVQDRATAALMERFYEGYSRGIDPGTALAGAQRALLASPATAHPYYWAGFELMGQR